MIIWAKRKSLHFRWTYEEAVIRRRSAVCSFYSEAISSLPQVRQMFGEYWYYIWYVACLHGFGTDRSWMRYLICSCWRGIWLFTSWTVLTSNQMHFKLSEMLTNFWNSSQTNHERKTRDGANTWEQLSMFLCTTNDLSLAYSPICVHHLPSPYSYEFFPWDISHYIWDHIPAKKHEETTRRRRSNRMIFSRLASEQALLAVLGLTSVLRESFSAGSVSR